MGHNAHPTKPNPMGTNGFEFLEFTSPEPQKLIAIFTALGFACVAKHAKLPIQLYQQGEIRFLLNQSPTGHAAQFRAQHGPSICGMAFRVLDAKAAEQQLLTKGAHVVIPRLDRGTQSHVNDNLEVTELSQVAQIPTIKGVGGSLLYLIENNVSAGQPDWYAKHFVPVKQLSQSNSVGLTYLDHVTHNLHQGQMDVWAKFYEQLFGFYEIRYFDIKGEVTGLKSRAMTSPCGKIRIPLNESSDDQSQIEEFLRDYHGEGIQHVALGTDNIYEAVAKLRANGVSFMTVPDTYYEMLENRLSQHGEETKRLQDLRILIDGNTKEGDPRLLLQIFTNTLVGPIFFEIIQRKGDQGFGEGNFKALFESIERDQIRRGVIQSGNK